ncbi:MAG: DNA-deoxyinosine glycosylase [Eubacterium sp.]|nr:DNA-deoxyinosine glycosylase [Eubacterium sp.]
MNMGIIVTHPFPPLYDENSEVLILGSFPSVKSRETHFFYGHPQNRFWKVIANIFHETIPVSIDEKKELILRNHLALWDVILECEITGSSDASIKNAKANDIRSILKASSIQKIIVNGKTAEKLYIKYIEPVTGMRAVALPSTSPANAAWSIERLREAWAKEILNNYHGALQARSVE